MENKNKTRERLISYCKKYHKIELQDIFKYIYQSSFGCEHMLNSVDKSIEFIRADHEEKIAFLNTDYLVEELDGRYSRVNLSYLDKGLSAETLGRIFCASAKKESRGVEALEEKIIVLRELISEKLIDFSLSEFEVALTKWRNDGYQSLSHSDLFRKTYNPSYRVISNEYVRILPLLAKIDTLLQNDSAIIAIEGGSASGKTTLGALLSNVYDATIFHMDDFFLRPEQRTCERYSEVGGNIDWERFSEEVLIPLNDGKIVKYRRFDCSTMSLKDIETVMPERLVVVEGVYSMHPKLAGYYDISVFLDISHEYQRKRIEKRNPPHIAKCFFEQWIPLENRYFEFFDVKERCDIVISSD